MTTDTASRELTELVNKIRAMLEPLSLDQIEKLHQGFPISGDDELEGLRNIVDTSANLGVLKPSDRDELISALGDHPVIPEINNGWNPEAELAEKVVIVHLICLYGASLDQTNKAANQLFKTLVMSGLPGIVESIKSLTMVQ